MKGAGVGALHRLALELLKSNLARYEFLEAMVTVDEPRHIIETATRERDAGREENFMLAMLVARFTPGQRALLRSRLYVRAHRPFVSRKQLRAASH